MARRNNLPRASSPAGVEARHDRRLNTHPKGGVFGKANQVGRKPGSRNPKKVGR